MAADTLKSRSITNLDSNPIIYDAAGFNIGAREVVASDFSTPTGAGLVSTASLYKTVRVRSNVKLTSLKLFVSTLLDTNASKTLTWDVGLYYSDNTQDGTLPVNQGVLISANLLGAAIVSPGTAKLPGAVEVLPISPSNMGEELWEFAGLTSDPKCYFDIVLAVHAAAATAATGDIGVIVRYND